MTTPNDCNFDMIARIITPDGVKYEANLNINGILAQQISVKDPDDLIRPYKSVDLDTYPRTAELRVLLAARLQQLADILMAADPEPLEA